MSLLKNAPIDFQEEMLEVTLMNKSAQKRGKWEPVLRNSLNNKAEHMEIDTLTFFVTDELDYNMINIWRSFICDREEIITFQLQ